MKAHWINALGSLLLLLFFSFPMAAQDDSAEVDSTGLPGDHFSLQGAIELFKKAESPEDFEKLLNAEDSKINNLDLNEDGEVDYIRVIDNMDGDVHALILQVPVSETESQDIAVIEIEKQGDDYAILQIVGDEDVYGEQVIAEPFDEDNGVKKGRGGPAINLQPYRVVVNVWLWPSVRFMYRPGYTVWVSPWRWRHYPTYWRPWRPYPWRTYYVGVRPYHRHVHVVTTHRVVRAHSVYTPRRTHSTVVRTKTTTTVTRRKAGGAAVGQRTTTTTVKRNANGRVTKEKTTTTRGAKRGPNGAAAGKKTTTTKTVKRRRGG